VQQVRVDRWTFWAGVVAFVGAFGVSTTWSWARAGLPDPSPAVYLVPFALIVLSFAWGGIRAQRTPLATIPVERWTYVLTIVTFVLGYVLEILGPLTTPPGANSVQYPGFFLVPLLLLLLSYGIGYRETTGPEPAPVGGPSNDGADPDGPVRAGAENGARPIRRYRTFDRSLVVLAPLAMVGVMLLWTGLVPSLYLPNPEGWNLLTADCPAGPVPGVQHTFPLWATVRIEWSSNFDVVFSVNGMYLESIFEYGRSGNATFVSSAQPVEFQMFPESNPGSSCDQDVLVQILATFTI
jgi:hypothetical protein